MSQRTDNTTDVVEEFKRIRDIPYSIPLSEDEKDNSCSGKVVELKTILEAAGYDARFRVCDFRWSSLTLPKKVTQLPHNDNSTHVYLEVYNGDGWIDVDPTWDSALGTVLPIAAWDGVSSTEIAVTPLHVYTLEESDHIMAQQDTEALEKDLAENGAFYHMLNQWLEEVRARL